MNTRATSGSSPMTDAAFPPQKTDQPALWGAGMADPVLGWDEMGSVGVSEEDVERLVMEALSAGRLDIISALADRLGPERMVELAPNLMERAFATGDEALLEALIMRGLLRRPFLSKPARNSVATWDSPIRAAVGLGSVSLLQLIIDRCSETVALAQFVNADGHTLLFDSASATVANWLMDHGVDPDHRSASGVTALAHRLSLGPSGDSARLADQSSAVALAERCELSDRVVIALCVGLSLDSPEVLRAIVDRGVNPNVTISTGEPVLVAAVSRGFDETAVYLARNGADPYAITRGGECALDLAILAGRASLARELDAAFGSRPVASAMAERLEPHLPFAEQSAPTWP